MVWPLFSTTTRANGVQAEERPWDVARILLMRNHKRPVDVRAQQKCWYCILLVHLLKVNEKSWKYQVLSGSSHVMSLSTGTSFARMLTQWTRWLIGPCPRESVQRIASCTAPVPNASWMWKSWCKTLVRKKKKHFRYTVVLAVLSHIRLAAFLHARFRKSEFIPIGKRLPLFASPSSRMVVEGRFLWRVNII